MMKLKIQKDGKFSEAYPSTKSYIELISNKEFLSLLSVQSELKENGPPFDRFMSMQKLVLEGNPLFGHANIDVNSKLQTLYNELVEENNPYIAQRLYVDTKINDVFVQNLPLTITELPILEVYDINNFSRAVAKVVAKEQP
jgi:hypothetical protein